jgi:hypothetical protein
VFYRKKEAKDAGKSPSEDADGTIDRDAYYKDFKTLEVLVNASPEEVTDAYLRLKEAYSPDLVSMSSPVGDAIEKKRRQDMIGQIEAAYRSLQRLFEKEAPAAAPGSPEEDADADAAEPVSEDAEEAETAPETLWEPEAETAVDADPALEEPASGERPMVEIADFNGQTLREIREKMNVSLEQIYEETKIRIPTLENLENENFSELPPEVYVKGFVKSYARCLSLDPLSTLRIYMEKLQDWQRGRGGRKQRHQPHAPFRFSKKKGKKGELAL